METKRILRPNPNFGEDLKNHTIVGPDIASRLSTYTSEGKKREHVRICRCRRRAPQSYSPTVRLHDGHDMPAIGYCTWVSDTTPGSKALQYAVENAIDAGYRLIDTSPIFHSEEQVGQAISNKLGEGVVTREELYVVTKLSNDAHARNAVVPALRESLKRLGLDYVDLYLVAWPISQKGDDSPVNIDPLETWAGMVECRDLGLTRSIGLSHFSARQIDRLVALQHVRPVVLQVELNLTLQQLPLRTYCRRLQIAVMACAPFGSLFPSYAPAGAPEPRVDDPRLLALAARRNCTVPQLVLRYLLELGVVALPRSLVKARLIEDLDILHFSLRPEDRCLLRSYDCGYRIINKKKWEKYPNYPF